MRVQLGFVHAELQSGIVYGRRDIVIARNFNGIFGFHGFRSFGRVAVFQRPAFFEGRDISRVGRDFAVNIAQLFEVDRIAVCRSGYHVGDFLLACVNACGGYRRTICNGQSRCTECDVITCFEGSAACACESRKCFAQLKFVAYFLLIRCACYRFFLISNSQIGVFGSECRTFDGVYGSVYTRFFLRCNCDIVARFDGGSRRLQLRDVDRVIVVDTACYIDNTAIVRCDVRISYFIVRAAYGHNACSGFNVFAAEVCFSVNRFFGKGVAADSDTVFVISTRTGSECYAAFFINNGVRTDGRCKFRTGICPMADRCRFFFKCTCLHAQCRAVVTFCHCCRTDCCCIAVVRLSACAQCGRLVTECTCLKADCHGFFLCAFVFTRLGIIILRYIRVGRFPFV